MEETKFVCVNLKGIYFFGLLTKIFLIVQTKIKGNPLKTLAVESKFFYYVWDVFDKMFIVAGYSEWNILKKTRYVIDFYFTVTQ
jgi:hypothetical protein